MTFRQFAINNVLRNKRLYIAYFLTSLFAVMVFFTFSIFASHPQLSGDQMGSSVKSGMNVAAGIIYVFSFFFVLYSMSSFLQSRKKEFGLLMIQGMSMKQIRSMVFMENMLIGSFATVGGIMLGLVFAKGILLLAENVLVIENGLPFYFPTQSIIITFGCFIVLFFFISLFVSYILRSQKLIDLIKGDQQSKGEPKANLFLTLLAVLLLGSGYTVALLVKGAAVVAALVPVVVVVIIGTYLLFTQLSVFLIRRLKKNQNVFWHKTNMILLSDLSFRIKDNARTFFLVAIISTVAFSAIGTLYGFQSVTNSQIESGHPTSMSYWDMDDEAGNEEENIATINQELEEADIVTEQAQVELPYFTGSEDHDELIVKESEYNRMAAISGQKQVQVQDDAPILAISKMAMMGRGEGLLAEAVTELKSGTVLEPVELMTSDVLPGFSGIFIVSDADYAQLPDPDRTEKYYVWQEENDKDIPIELAKELDQKFGGYGIQIASYESYLVNKGYGTVLFIGLFIGIVFFVSAGSFLYFRLYSDLDEDKRKFQSITKMGLTEKELKKVLNRQILILFFAPIAVALVHGAVALTALSHMFYHSLVQESIIVLGVFLAIQIVYFFIVRFYYIKQVKQVL